MPTPSDSFLTGANIDFIEALYSRFLADPNEVDPSWRALFSTLQREGKPLVIDGLVLPPVKRAQVNGATVLQATPSSTGMQLQSKVDQMVMAFRLRGHLLAQLDPLGVPRQPLEHVADMPLTSSDHFTEKELDTEVSLVDTLDPTRVPTRILIERMRKTYAHHIGVEFAHMYDSERRRWLRRKMETSLNTTDYTVDEQLRILRKLTEAETFETTIHSKFQGQKRFSAEGGEVQVAMINEFLELGGQLGVKEVVFGMAHRGRLNVLANILGKPADEIFAEIAGPSDPKQYLNRHDVKYHMGYSRDLVTESGAKIHLTMAFNPSHLGFVHPVVEGRVRAKQDRMGGGAEAKKAVVPFVIHGDAAFSGQGLVPETLNLSGLDAYDTGGTVHLIINNQIGYTTEARQGRTPLYCTAQAQLLDIPIFHVNGDDAEACVHVMKLATEYRQKFNTDVVIDLVCYRKYGHNEGDEPRFTQPTMYKLVDAEKTVRAQYAEELAKKNRVSAEQSKALLDQCNAQFSDAITRSRTQSLVKDPDHLHGVWAKYRGGADKDTAQVETGLPEEELKKLLAPLAKTPEGFTLHPNVQKGIVDKRAKMISAGDNLDWGAGEMLAYATLINQGYRVRVTGQDTERGTFAHRQAVLHDQKTGKQAFPLDDIKPGAAKIVNSPLSEMACMAFEYGYSLDAPDVLIAWEAQFGDFANNAQVMIDQFLAASEDKWKRMSALTLLLPHGYEGAGPEHSSARLERFLELAAEDNIQVCYPTSAAQIFHLLRRQAVRPIRKPLVVMTPKSLLRMPEATSPWADFTKGTYKKVIADNTADVSKVTRVLFCSGKVYFDLVKAREATKNTTTAVVRVEQLYPLPVDELVAVLDSYKNLKEVFWVQEEPKNSGAWRYIFEPLLELSQARNCKLKYVGRPESASPATGFLSTHQYEQKLLVDEALS
ncbi:MAG: 2-oxoglutarate dehydrogenase E1 component [Archangium gephyra]|uniref:oxoglutarate dehydrogenase (succinyl-transferring) n=1 Tax=Archangium gephyra TaxID=48 RepID=A0A2W5T3C3_9BACT|nr:MAG: 2-oxoglutarate dehydrogenase E1 component [Archangium gephyra]